MTLPFIPTSSQPLPPSGNITDTSGYPQINIGSAQGTIGGAMLSALHGRTQSAIEDLLKGQLLSSNIWGALWDAFWGFVKIPLTWIVNILKKFFPFLDWDVLLDFDLVATVEAMLTELDKVVDWIREIPFVDDLIDAVTGGLATTWEELRTWFGNVWNFLGSLNFLDPDFDLIDAAIGFIDVILAPAEKLATLTLGKLTGGQIPDIDASKILTGIVDIARLPGITIEKIIGVFGGDGKLLASLLPEIDATKIVGMLGIDKIAGLADWIDKTFIQPLIGALTGNGLKLDLGALGTWASDLLNRNSKIPAGNIFGTLQAGLVSIIPVGSVTQTYPNLLQQGAFDLSESIEASGNWSWDSTSDQYNNAGSGSLKVTCNGNTQVIYSTQSVPVALNDKINVGAAVKSSGSFPWFGDTIFVSIIPFKGTVQQTAQTIFVQSHTFGNWIDREGAYQVLDPQVTSVRVRLGVSNLATGGQVNFDNVRLTKRNLVQQTWVERLTDAWDNFWRGVFGGNPIGKTVDDLFEVANTLWGKAKDGFDDAGRALAGVAELVGKLFNAAGEFIMNIGKAVIDGVNTTGAFLTKLLNGLLGFPTGDDSDTSTANVIGKKAGILAVTSTNADLNAAAAQEVANRLRVFGAWISDPTDDAAFARALVDSSSAPPANKVVLIPITVHKVRTIEAVKIGIDGALTMSNCYMALYDVARTASTSPALNAGDVRLIADLGDVKSSLQTTNQLQVIPLATPVVVQENQLIYLAVLQTGTAAKLSQWSKGSTTDLGTGLIPRSLGMQLTNLTGTMPLPASSGAVVFGDGAITAGTPKYWGAVGTVVAQQGGPSYTPQYYSDTFDRGDSATLGSLWVNRVGNGMGILSGGAAATGPANGGATYLQRLASTSQQVEFNINVLNSNRAGWISLRGNGAGQAMMLYFTRVAYVPSGGRTDVYLLQTWDYGASWTGRAGPLTIADTNAPSAYPALYKYRLTVTGNTYIFEGWNGSQWVAPGLNYIDVNNMLAYDGSFTEVGLGGSYFFDSRNGNKSTILDNWSAKDI